MTHKRPLSPEVQARIDEVAALLKAVDPDDPKLEGTEDTALNVFEQMMRQSDFYERRIRFRDWAIVVLSLGLIITSILAVLR